METKVEIVWDRVGNEVQPPPTDITEYVDTEGLGERIAEVVGPELAGPFEIRIGIKVNLYRSQNHNFNFGTGKITIGETYEGSKPPKGEDVA